MKSQQFIRVSIVLIILLGTISYSLISKKGVESYFRVDSRNEPETLLKKIPEIEVVSVQNDSNISLTLAMTKQGRPSLVHFWGTWCAPCEAELPAFLELVNKFQTNSINVGLLAVNDESLKIKKFIERFTMPKDVDLLLDNTGKAMELFGTFKVPETYLFDGEGRLLKKFIGPQDWAHPHFYDQISLLINK